MKNNVILFVLFVSVMAFGQTKPNILIIHTDDLGYHDLSFTGSQLYNTPNIDKLAEQSVSFTNAYSSYPRCTPSRYGMMTGTYPVNENKGHLGGVPEDKNFIKQFNNSGYNTSYVGKWHLGKGDSDPKPFGFKHSYAAGEAGGIGSRFYPFNTQANGKPAKYNIPNIKEDGKEGNYASDLLTDATIDFIKKNNENQPFLAILAFYAVHTPIEAKPEDEARNKEELKSINFGSTPEYIKEGEGRRKMRQDDAAYAGMVENVDENVGRLLQTLKDMGIDKNTIIVFSSDHGGLSNDGHKGKRHLATTNLPLKAGKGHLYEGGIRVPLFVKWSKELKPRTDEESIIVGMDVFPTLLELAINKKMEGIDGKSYASVLKGKESWEDRTVFWISRKARPHSTGDSKAAVVRSGDYKLIQFLDTDKVELYNLKKDLGENKNLATIESNKTTQMLGLLKDWKKDFLVPERLNVLQGKNKKNKSKGKATNNLLIGTTLNHHELNTIKEELFLKDFRYLTPANAAKQTRIHPKPNVWKWQQINDFIKFADKNNLVVRLHGPISPQASKWVKADNRTPEELETILVEFSTAFAMRFNNEPSVKWMDVVNETILANGNWFGPKTGVDKWENPWLKIGLDENGFPLYILKAFEIATKHAANLKLIYNQNAGMETIMWNKVKETVLYLRSKGYRVDGIGWQAHLLLGAKRKDFVDNIDATMEKLSDLIDWAHANNLAFHVTELDYLVKDVSKLDTERQIQKRVYQKIVDVLQSKSKNGEVTLNLWDLGVRSKKGMGDFQSIYDENFNPTPAYQVIKNVLKNN